MWKTHTERFFLSWASHVFQILAKQTFFWVGTIPLGVTVIHIIKTVYLHNLQITTEKKNLCVNIMHKKYELRIPSQNQP